MPYQTLISDSDVQICEGCGAFVFIERTDVHDRFHEALAKAARQADSADMWTRPIGGPL